MVDRVAVPAGVTWQPNGDGEWLVLVESAAVVTLDDGLRSRSNSDSFGNLQHWSWRL